MLSRINFVLLTAFSILTSGLLSPMRAMALDVVDAFGRYERQTWKTENGLPQNSVHAILQTHDGYIWLGTEGGLARFDGVRFTAYDMQNTPGLKSNDIRGLTEAPDGTLWIGTAGGVVRYRESQFRSFGSESGLPSENVWSVNIDKEGVLWAGTGGGFAELLGNHFVRSNRTTTSDGDATVAKDAFGTIWIGTASGAVSMRGNETRLEGFNIRGEVTAIAFDLKAQVWIGTEHGLEVFGNGVHKRYARKDGLPGDRITALMADRKGAVWVAADSGLARVVNGKVERLPTNDALSSSTVLTLFEDREGSVWIGTDLNGLTILRKQKFYTYAFSDTIKNDQVRCVMEDRKGTVWIGTNGSGLKRFANEHVSGLTTQNGLSSNVILSLAEDANGDLLVGTPDGLNRIQHEKISTVTAAQGLAEDFIRSIYADQDGSLWVGTRRGLSQIKNGQVTTFSQSNGLGSDLVGALLRDRDGDLWIGTLHGLTRFQGGRFKNYTKQDGLSGDVITDLYEGRDGAVWIATQDGGLSRFRDQRFQRFGPKAGLPETIYGMAEDSNGDLWLAAKTGIFQIRRNDLEHVASGIVPTVAINSYGTSDGLRVQECSGGGHPAVWKDHLGAIWFSTARGVAILAANHNALNAVPPPVVLESVSIDDQVFEPSRVTEVAAGHARLSFEYAGLSYVAPQSVRFKYKLNGFDHAWIDAGTRRTAYYTNVPPGSYEFQVIARNGDGIWNKRGVSFKIGVQPHFYQTWWFHSVLALLVGLLMYAVYYWRLKRVEQQFNLLLRERNRIAREIHDTLAQGFAGLSVQLELVNRLLESPTEAVKEHLNRARTLVRESLSEARRSIWELRSQEADSRDLAGRFSKLSRQVSEISGTDVQLRIHGTYRQLDLLLEDEVFRIGQEALTNAIRHSGAKRITIDLTFTSRKLKMTVADDGNGFVGEKESSGPDGHFGLQGMEERAEQIRGELTIQSSVGSGTTVSLEAPAK